MGLTFADITLANGVDEVLAQRGSMRHEDVRAIAVTALVDSGAVTLVINKNTKEELGLDVTETIKGRIADGSRPDVEITSPVTIRYKGRTASVRAYVVPNAPHTLLGCIPLEEMNVTLNPVKQKLELPTERGEEDIFTLIY